MPVAISGITAARDKDGAVVEWTSQKYVYLQPSRDEEAAVQDALHMEIPTREEMQEIEASSRLYTDNGSVVMTLSVLSKTATALPEIAAITPERVKIAILSRSTLIPEYSAASRLPPVR